MDWDYKSALGLLASVIVFINMGVYTYRTWRGMMRPHLFTFLIYLVTTVIVAAGMVVEGAGAGAWSMIVFGVVYVVICILTLRKGLDYVSRADVLMLGLCLLGLPLWWLTSGPQAPMMFLLVVELVGTVPMIRKGYVLPHEDSPVASGINGVVWALSLAAIPSTEAWASVVYAAAWMVVCFGIAALLWWRQRVVAN